MAWKVLHLGRVNSTNEYIRERVEILDDRFAVIADSQSAGKGRLGRSWCSPPGGFYASLLLKPPPSPEYASRVSLLAADLLCDLLSGSQIEASVKWPNDVLLGGRKLAGILPEYGTYPVPWFILGIGLNLRSRPEIIDRRGLDPAAWTDAGLPPDPLLFLSGFLERMDEAWPDRDGDPLANRIASINRRLWKLDEEVGIARGFEIVRGTVRGIEDDGCLVLETVDGIRYFDSGELRPVRDES